MKVRLSSRRFPRVLDTQSLRVSDKMEEEQRSWGIDGIVKDHLPLQLVKPEIWTMTVDSYFLGKKILTFKYWSRSWSQRSDGSVEGQRKKHFGAILVESLTWTYDPQTRPKNVHVYRPSPPYSPVSLVNEKKKKQILLANVCTTRYLSDLNFSFY